MKTIGLNGVWNLHMFTLTLPAFREMGLTEEEEDWIMRRNPQRITPVG